MANQVAEAIVLYEQTHGAYPATTEEAGVSNRYARTQMVIYSNKSGRPFIMYPVTFMTFLHVYMISRVENGITIQDSAARP